MKKASSKLSFKALKLESLRAQASGGTSTPPATFGNCRSVNDCAIDRN